MPTIRAKFECTLAQEVEYGTEKAVNVSMQAVWGDGTDDASWSKATPFGQIDMTITNPAALGSFVVGAAYYLDFTPLSDVDLDGLDGVTVVDTEAEVAQPGGPAEAWAARAAQSPPASTIVVPPTADPTPADPAPAAPTDASAAPADPQAAPPAPAPAPDAAPAAAAN